MCILISLAENLKWNVYHCILFLLYEMSFISVYLFVYLFTYLVLFEFCKLLLLELEVGFVRILTQKVNRNILSEGPFM